MRDVNHILIDAIGEEAADAALDAITQEAEKHREGRENVQIVIAIYPDGSTAWGKAVKSWRREIDGDHDQTVQ